MTSVETMQSMHLYGLMNICPNCQTRMELEDEDKSGKPLLLRLLNVDVYTCPNCGKSVLTGPMFNNN